MRLATPESGPAMQVKQGFAPQAPGLLTADGKPMVSPSVEAALQREYPSYRLEWLDAAWGMSGFVLKEQWKANDPRWQEVQEGKRDPQKTFDVVHRFDADTRQDDILAFIQNRMTYVRDPVKEAERMIQEGMRRLEAAQNVHINRAVDTGVQRIMDESDHTRAVRAGLETAHPMVSGADFSEPKRLL